MVEALDRNFKNVCELDIIFNVEQVQYVSQSFPSAPHTAPLCWAFGPSIEVVLSCREVVECDGVRLRYLLGYLLTAQVHWVVDEMVVGGMVAETNMNDILDAVESQARLARQEQGIGNGGVGAQGQPPSF